MPRENFLGPGPWKVLAAAPGQMRPILAEVSDESELYRDVAVLLDPARSLTNGNPGTLAPWLDALHLSPAKSVFQFGCGAGYYTAVLAEVVGPGGAVMAVENDPALAAIARRSLAAYPNVEFIEGDGGAIDPGPRDAILINAGVTHPAASWLAALRPGGRLVVPLTADVGVPHIGKGMVLAVTRGPESFGAHFLPSPIMIYSATSVRDPAMGALLARAFMTGTFASVRSLRTAEHAPAPECWLHAPGFCLSTAA